VRAPLIERAHTASSTVFVGAGAGATRQARQPDSPARQPGKSVFREPGVERSGSKSGQSGSRLVGAWSEPGRSGWRLWALARLAGGFEHLEGEVREAQRLCRGAARRCPGPREPKGRGLGLGLGAVLS
ncbi:hypothetical protein NDU88_005909, partial [Pleurodeles waltl]